MKNSSNSLEELPERDFASALLRSARNLSPDEKYILRKLALEIANRLDGAPRNLAITLVLPVSAFSEQTGVRGKHAYRRLGAAAETIFMRSVVTELDGWAELHFRWASSMWTGEPGFELEFTETFVRYVVAAQARPSTAQRSSSGGLRYVQADNSDFGSAPVQGATKLQPKRPRRVITWLNLIHRVKKRLKKVLPADQVDDLIDFAGKEEPWSRASRSKFHQFTARDLTVLYDWIMARKDAYNALED